MDFKKIHFEHFHYFDNLLELPKHSLFYRGVSRSIRNEDILKRTLIFLTCNKELARYYGDGHYCSIETTKPIKVMDLRKVGSLLSIMLDFMPKTNNRVLLSLMTSFGFITDMTTQYQSLKCISDMNQDYSELRDAASYFYNKMNVKKKEYNIIYNPKGVRFSITSVDGYAYEACKSIFGRYFDGIISPNLDTIESNTKTFQGCELVLFEPEQCLKLVNENERNITEVQLNTMLFQNYRDLTFTFEGQELMKGMFVAQEGGTSQMPVSHDRNRFLDKKSNENRIKKEVDKFIKSLPIKLSTFKQTYLETYHVDPRYGLSGDPNSFFDDEQIRKKRSFKV